MTGSVNRLTASVKALPGAELYIKDYLDLLEKHFRQREPGLKAFVAEDHRFARLRREAQALFDRYPHPQDRPALFGVPVGVKDIFNVDGFETRAGSQLPAAEFEGPEAECVTRLKQAGALILGKTISTEFAYFAAGFTCNPHHEGYTPGGSSSGSAAAVGAGLCPLTLGTQTVGSISRPAAFCGVVGFKPSYERVSRSGVVPVSASLDHVGFFTSDAESAKLAASVLVADWKDITVDHPPVLAVPDGPYLEKVSPEGRRSFEETCERLAAGGYQVKRLSVMPDFDDIRERHMLIMAAEAAQAHADWFSRYEQLYHDKTTALVRQGMAVSEQDLRKAMPGREKLRRQLVAAMMDAGVDLWISPSATGTAPRGLDSTGDPIMNLPWSHCGVPTLSLPSGKNDIGLPFGLQIAGKWYEDENVLEWAMGLEKVIAYDN